MILWALGVVLYEAVRLPFSAHAFAAPASSRCAASWDRGRAPYLSRTKAIGPPV
jgi:hypothetical protein